MLGMRREFVPDVTSSSIVDRFIACWLCSVAQCALFAIRFLTVQKKFEVKSTSDAHFTALDTIDDHLSFPSLSNFVALRETQFPLVVQVTQKEANGDEQTRKSKVFLAFRNFSLCLVLKTK